jgi:hypothetical protein
MIELYAYPFPDRIQAEAAYAELRRSTTGFVAETGDAAVIWRDEEGVWRLARIDELGPEAPPFPWRALVSALVTPGDEAAPPRWNEAFAASLRAVFGRNRAALLVLRRQFTARRAFRDLARHEVEPLRTLLADETIRAMGDRKAS